MLHVSTASGYMGKWSDLVTHHRSMQNLMSNTLRNRTSCTEPQTYSSALHIHRLHPFEIDDGATLAILTHTILTQDTHPKYHKEAIQGKTDTSKGKQPAAL